MFERNKIDTTKQRHALAVEITLTDKQVLSGNLSIPMSKSLGEILNGTAGFVEFEPFGGQPQFIAKSSLQTIRPIDVPQPRPLKPAAAAGNAFDPHAILGLRKGAAADELRKAYHKLSLAYHPDRYATAELPAEVRQYLEETARRINTAYDTLAQQQATAKRHAQMKTDPIYESGRPA